MVGVGWNNVEGLATCGCCIRTRRTMTMAAIAGTVQRTNNLRIGVVANSCSFIPLFFSLDFLSLFHITRTFGNNDVTNIETIGDNVVFAVCHGEDSDDGR